MSLRGWSRQRPSSQEMKVSSIINEIDHRGAASCARANVRWQMSFWDGSVTGLRELARPTDLLALGQTLQPLLKKELLRAARRPGFPPMLVCSPTAPRASRALVVDQGGSDGRSFLTGAVGLCRRLQAHPIVLTVARSERAARSRQQVVRDVVAAGGLDADFDFLVGADVCTAVTQVAHWRRCPLVILERRGRTPWWRRTPGTSALAAGAEPFSVLTLPETGVAPDFQLLATPSLPSGSLYNQEVFRRTPCPPRVPMNPLAR